MNRRQRRRRRWLQAGTGLIIAVAGVMGVRALVQGISTSGGQSISTKHLSSNKVVPVITKSQGAETTSNSTSQAGSTATKRQQANQSAGTLSQGSSIPQHVLLSVPAQNQHPQLPNGCEVTSLSMLLQAVGHPVSKMTLAKQAPRAAVSVTWKNGATGLPKDWRFDIQSWGNPNKGFVGHMTHQPGYGIYHGPLTQLLNNVLPGKAVDLTGKPIHQILAQVAHGVPVVMWVNTTFKPLPASDWVTWNNPGGAVKATFFEHAVLLVGYSKHNLYINNPFNGQKAEAVNRTQFIAAWNQMGGQALTVKNKGSV